MLRLPILLAVLLFFVENSFSQTLVSHNLWPDPFEGCDVLLTQIIAMYPLPYCSYIVVTDRDLHLDAIVHKEILGNANTWGLATYELKDGNGTYIQAATMEVLKTATKARKLSWNTVVILMSNNLEFLSSAGNYISKARLLIWTTRLIVVTSLPLKNISSLLGHQWTFSMMNTILLNSDRKDSVNRWSIYANMPYSKKPIKRIAFWNQEKDMYLLDESQLFSEKYSSFHGSKVNVSGLPFAPYFFYKNKTNADGSISETIMGTDGMLLHTLAQTLNFTIYMLPATTWKEVGQLVIDRVSFFAACFHYMLPERMERYDYSYPYEFASMSFAAAKPAIIPKWQALYYPLADIVWVAILLTILVSFVFFNIVNSSGSHFSSQEKMKIISVAEVVLCTVFSQPLSVRYPSINSFRVILGFWLIFAFIVSTAYRGNLTASLTLPKYPPRAETIGELVTVIDAVTMPAYATEHRDFFRKSNSPVFRTVGENMILGPSVEEGLQRALTNKEAFMEGRRYVEQNIAQYFTNSDGTTPLYIGRESVIPGMSAWPIPHDAPFKPQVDKVMMAVIEGGLYEKWSRDTVHGSRLESMRLRRKGNEKEIEEGDASTEESEKEDKSLMTLNLIHMQGPFMILLLGLILSSLFFIAEIFM